MTTDTSFGTLRDKFFKAFHAGDPSGDPWHSATRSVVHKVTALWHTAHAESKPSLILNAGSGGVDYGINGPMVHLDLFYPEDTTVNLCTMGDCDLMPFRSEVFSSAICVGSVLNYCDPIRCIKELSRTLRQDGVAIIEYERSASADFMFQSGYATGASRFKTFFGNEQTILWAYGDKYINDILTFNNLEVIKSFHFHNLSSIVLAISRSPKFAAGWIWFDKLAALAPFLNCLASNRILMVKKIPC